MWCVFFFTVLTRGRSRKRRLMVCSPLCTYRCWGKFGEKANKGQTTTVKSPAAYYQLMNDPALIVQDIRCCTPHLVEVDTSKVDEDVEISAKTNVFVAIYTTAHSRLKLCEGLETLQERVLYFDTDSLIYSTKPGEAELELGP